MNLVLLLFVTTSLGITYGNGPHAGNFMASSPCFSFQGQNILWPAGPHGIAGMSSPMGCFNHPFFSGGGGGGSFPTLPGPPKLCPFGEPIEASSPVSKDVEAHRDIPAASSGPTVEHSSSSVETPSHTEISTRLSEVPAPGVITDKSDNVPAPVDVATPSVDINALTHAATPSIDINTPTHVATPSVDINAPTHAATPSIDINTPTHVATPSVDIHAPADITTSSVNAHAPSDVATSSVDIHAPANVAISSVDIHAPANVATPSVDIHAPTNVATPSVDIHSPSNVATPSVDIHAPTNVATPVVDIPTSTVITHTSINGPVPTNVVTPSVDIPTQNVITAPSTDSHAPSAVIPPGTDTDPAKISPIISSEASEPVATILPAPSMEIPVIFPPSHATETSAPVVEKHLASSEVLPTTATTPRIDEEASACPQPKESPSSDSAKPTDASNATCPGIPSPTVCPSLADACNNSCPDYWNSCDFPDFHQLYDNRCLGPHYCPDFDASGIHANQYFDQSCGTPCMYPCGGHELNHYPDYYPCYDPGYETRFLPSVSSLNVTDANNLNFTDIERFLPSNAKIVKDLSELNCTTHGIIKEVKPYIDECITHIPIIRNKITQKEETITRHIPIVTNHVSTQEENRLCHIPIVNQHARSIIGHHTDHVPITQSSLVPLVQSYTQQIPIKRSYIRPIVESSESHVPVMDTHCNPFIHDYVNTISGPEKRIRPIVHEDLENLPVSHHIPSYDQFASAAPGMQHYQHFDGNALASINNYGEASNDIPSSYNQVQPSFENSCGQPFVNEESGIRSAPQHEHTLHNFRRNLYLRPPCIVRGYEEPQVEGPCSNAFPDYSEAPAAAPVEGHYQQGESVAPSQDFIDGGCSAPADDYLPAPENPNQEPMSATLTEGFPFPQENAEGVTDDSAGYTRHPDYCE